MIKSFPVSPSHVSNSYEVVKRLSNIYLEDGFQLVSLDVISLFTNVPTNLIFDSVSSRWNHISPNCDIPRDEFLSALKFILESSFFTFNNIIYKQSFGTPMGSPLSPTVADIVLQDLENKVLASLKFIPPFIYMLMT